MVDLQGNTQPLRPIVPATVLPSKCRCLADPCTCPALSTCTSQQPYATYPSPEHGTGHSAPRAMGIHYYGYSPTRQRRSGESPLSLPPHLVSTSASIHQPRYQSPIPRCTDVRCPIVGHAIVCHAHAVCKSRAHRPGRRSSAGTQVQQPLLPVVRAPMLHTCQQSRDGPSAAYASRPQPTAAVTHSHVF